MRFYILALCSVRLRQVISSDIMRASSPCQPYSLSINLSFLVSPSHRQHYIIFLSINSHHLFNYPSLSLLFTIFSPYSAGIRVCTATPDPLAQSPGLRARQYTRHTNVFGKDPTRLQLLCFRGVNLLVSLQYHLSAFLKPHFEKDPLGSGALPLSASLSQFRVVPSLLFNCS